MGNFRIFLNGYIYPFQHFLQFSYWIVLRTYSVKLRVYSVIFWIGSTIGHDRVEEDLLIVLDIPVKTTQPFRS